MEEPGDFKCVIRSALVRELLANNSLFVGKLYEDKSLAPRARDSIFSTTDLLHNNSLLELIYFLIILVRILWQNRDVFTHKMQFLSSFNVM